MGELDDDFWGLRLPSSSKVESLNNTDQEYLESVYNPIENAHWVQSAPRFGVLNQV